MSAKKAKWMLTVLQTAMVALMFLPVADFTDSGVRGNTFDLLRRYGQLNYRFGSFFYLLSAVCGPVMATVCVWRLTVRKNFGAASWFGAMVGLVHACFYTAAQVALAGSVRLTWVRYLVVIFCVADLFTAIFCYLMAPPTPRNEKE